MSFSGLEKYLPENGLFFVQKWLQGHRCTIKLRKERASKLGDYKRLRAENAHQITINHNMEPQLFFFVLTHEIAHLIAFSEQPKIAAHGQEWKNCFRNLLLDSLSIYDEGFKPLLVKFSKNPKANFASSPELVKYFHATPEDGLCFIDDLQIGETFAYRTEYYTISERLKKRYLCRNLKTGKNYLFRMGARVKKQSL